MLLAGAFSLYLLAVLLIDALAAPRGRFRGRPAWSYALSVLAFSLLYAVWFAVSWRPIFSAVSAIVTFVIVMLISNHKVRRVQEPLNFMDFALIPQVWRHPMLYQAEFLRHPVFVLGAMVLLGVIFAWCHFVEPSMLPDGRWWDWGAPSVLLVAFVIAWGVAGPLPASLTAALNRRMVPADSAQHVRAMGLAASLVAGLIGWRGAATERDATARSPPVRIPRAAPSPVVIAVQSESFVDLYRAGLHEVRLPGLEAARRRAVAHGRLKVPVQGAWTLRSEFAFLTGRPLESFGLDALHPYLRLDHPPRTLAHHLRDAGFRTLFAHPFDLDFFNRRAAMPKLGFDRLLGDDDFAGVEREGYFVPDLALAERILAEAFAEPAPFFCLAATMENHNPWDGRRIPGVGTAVDQYIFHLRNADRMIDRLVEGVEQLGRPAVLAFYGDHVPIIPELADPFPDTCTDYFVMGMRERAWLTGAQRDCALHELPGMILATLERVCRAECTLVSLPSPSNVETPT